MLVTRCQDVGARTVCQQIDPGLLQDVISAAVIEDLLETSQMWQIPERTRYMLALTSWLIALHVSPKRLQRAISATVVSGLCTVRDAVTASIPATSACKYRREHLGSGLLEERFQRRAVPQATTETPGACWRGIRVMALGGTVESVPDTASH